MTFGYGGGAMPDGFSEAVLSNQEAEDCLIPMGITSENVAADFNIPRSVQDEFAAKSFQKAAAAQKAESKLVAPSRKSTLNDAKTSQPKPSTPSRKSTLLRKEKEPEKEKPTDKDGDKKKADKEPKDASKPIKPSVPSRTSSLFTLPALPGLRRAPMQAEPQTMLEKVSAQVPLWLLATTEALATLANDDPDVLTAVATVLVAVGTVSGGGSAAVAAIGEAAIVVGRALKVAHDRVHGGAQGAQGR